MIKVWFLAMRPWSFTAAFIPIGLGAALAWAEGVFNVGLFLLTLLAGICTQAGTNLINTYGDYIFGVDTIESAHHCPQLVTGMLKPQSVKRAGITAFSVASILGIILTYLCGWPVFVVGLLGVIAGYCYTAGVCPYKYQGMGSILVFFLMGPLMVWPSYFIQTGKYSWVPILDSLPIGLLVSGILHTNDIRDYFHDQQAGIRTFALNIGFRRSLFLYYMIYIGAYLFLFALVFIDMLPGTVGFTLLLVPAAIKILRQAYDGGGGSDEKMKLLETDAAGFHFQFGVLLIIGVVLYPYLDRWLHA
jgi:1,4-dihydroxy-2-naphthoate polyprenyltransferase